MKNENLDRLGQPRVSLSPSQSSEKEFCSFKQNNSRASNGDTVISNIFPVIKVMGEEYGTWKPKATHPQQFVAAKPNFTIEHVLQYKSYQSVNSYDYIPRHQHTGRPQRWPTSSLRVPTIRWRGGYATSYHSATATLQICTIHSAPPTDLGSSIAYSMAQMVLGLSYIQILARMRSLPKPVFKRPPSLQDLQQRENTTNSSRTSETGDSQGEPPPF